MGNSQLAKFVKNLRVPRIVGMREKTLLDYKQLDYLRPLNPTASEFKTLFNDHEVIMLMIWALVSPSAALAYLIWKKYDRLRWLAVPLLVVSVFQFVGQWGGAIWLFERFVRGT